MLYVGIDYHKRYPVGCPVDVEDWSMVHNSLISSAVAGTSLMICEGSGPTPR